MIKLTIGGEPKAFLLDLRADPPYAPFPARSPGRVYGYKQGK